MGFFEILLIVACALIVISVIVSWIIRKKKGKTSCGCNCSSCGHCLSCNQSKNQQNNQKR